MSAPEYLLLAVSASSGEVREFPLKDEDRKALLADSEGGSRLVAIWTEVGGPTRFVVRAGIGPWKAPAAGAPAGPQRWAAEDAATFHGKVRYRIITKDPWLTVEKGYLQPGQLDL